MTDKKKRLGSTTRAHDTDKRTKPAGTKSITRAEKLAVRSCKN